MEPALDSTPEKIGGFRVIRRLATGGTSDVLLARAEGPHGFERVVVLKLLLAQYREQESFERMFAREAAAYARLSHPAIVKLFDFFSTDGQLVMVLEFVDGLPLNKLRALLRAQAGASDAKAGATRPGPVPGELDDRASLFVASRIFSALAAAHSARDAESGEFAPVIHRDVNPSNVLIPWDGHVKLADFGIAKVAGISSDTKAGYIKGTYGYMAPEQVRGEAVTPRTDVYAATLLLWELLARRKAIQRGALPDLEVLRAMAEPQLPSLDVLRPDLPADLRDAIRRGLEPNPDRRATFADELVAVLRASANLEEGRALLADAMATVRPPSAGEDLEKTQLRPARASAHSFADTEVFDRPAETERVPSLSEPDATLENQRLPSFADPTQAGPLPSFADAPQAPLPSFADAPPPKAPRTETRSFEAPPSPAPPRAVTAPRVGAAPRAPRPAARTAMGLGQMAPAPSPPSPTPSPPPVAASPPPPVARAQEASLPARHVPSASAPDAPSPHGRTVPMQSVPNGVSSVPTKTAPLAPPVVPTTTVPLTPPAAAQRSTPPPAPTAPRSTPPPAPTTSRSAPPPAQIAARSAPPAASAASRNAFGTTLPLTPAPPRFESPSYPAPPVAASDVASHAHAVPSRPPPVSVGPPRPLYAPAAQSPSQPTQHARVPPAPMGDFEAPDVAPRTRGNAWLLGAAVGFTVMCVVLVVGLLFIRWRAPAPASAVSTTSVTSAKPNASASSVPLTPVPSASTIAATPSATASATAAKPTASTPTVPPPAAPPSSSPPPSSSVGDLDTSSARPQHRVYVDGRVVGETPATFRVGCGRHQVKLGSRGVAQDVEVPCGGALKVYDR